MRLTRRTALALAPALAVPRARAQGQYPDRAIRLVVPFVPGGSVDLLARAVAQVLSPRLGQGVVVDNRPGGTTVVGTSFVARAAGDGYTLLCGGDSVELNRFLMPSLPYDPDRDLVPVLQLADVPYVLICNSTLPFRSLAGLVAYARQHPGELTYASFGIGGAGHLCGELLNRMAGIETLHVPYPGNPPALLDVAAGRVAFMFCTIPVAQPEIQNGRVRPLAMSSAGRVPVLGQVPTVAEAGLPGYESTAQITLYAPAGVPAPIIGRLSEVTREAMADAAFVRLLEQQGFVLSPPRDPAATRTHIKTHAAKWAGVIAAAGIRL